MRIATEVLDPETLFFAISLANSDDVIPDTPVIALGYPTDCNGTSPVPLVAPFVHNCGRPN
jgi:hypothetical protein